MHVFSYRELLQGLVLQTLAGPVDIGFLLRIDTGYEVWLCKFSYNWIGAYKLINTARSRGGNPNDLYYNLCRWRYIKMEVTRSLFEWYEDCSERVASDSECYCVHHHHCSLASCARHCIHANLDVCWLSIVACWLHVWQYGKTDIWGHNILVCDASIWCGRSVHSGWRPGK